MDPRKLFVDERLTGYCVYCGNGEAPTRDHVPSKVFLDQPYPPDLPVVHACRPCNESFSQDEAYLACLIECVKHGSAEPGDLNRERIQRLLKDSSALAARIAACASTDEAGVQQWSIEADRVRNVLMKLARGHAAYEFGEPQLDEPIHASWQPYHLIPADARDAFESVPEKIGGVLWPEIGSRASLRTYVLGDQLLVEEGWEEVQFGSYRYLAAYSGGVIIRFVLGDYLAGEVIWQ